MSSILRALKKAEQDGSVYRNNPDLKLNVQRIFNATNWSRPKKLFSNTQKAALISCIVLVSISLFFFILSIQKKPASTSTTNLKLTQKVQTIPAIPQKTVPPSIHKQMLSKKKPVVPLSSPAPLPLVKQTMEKPKISIKKRPILADVKPIPANNVPKIEFNEFTQIENDTLKIQAISWSKTPEDRIAVINNNIVGENDRILDFKVILIHKDAVILRKDNKNFSLKFKYH